MSTRLWEGICGLLAALWGLLVEGFLLFGPSYSFAQNTIGSPEVTGHTSLLGTGISPVEIISLSLLAASLIGIALTALIESRGGYRLLTRILLFASTVLLLLYSCAALASIGLLLIPSVLLALTASILAVNGDRVQRRHQQSRV